MGFLEAATIANDLTTRTPFQNPIGGTKTVECKKAPFMGPLGINMAVKERFELSIQFLVYTLSRRAP
jgi:hypothetical protein